MKALKTIDVNSTAIEKLPDSITQLKELFSLDLSFCKKLKKIPEQIGNMEGLRTFDACGTAIEQLPDSFVGLINLEELGLDECSKLQRLPEQLGEMQCLKLLSARDTAIEEVPDSIGLLSRLQVLDLNANEKLKYVPESIWNLSSIQTLSLDLSCNVRLCLPMILCLHSLERLTLTDEGHNFSFQRFNLRELTLNKCTSLGSSLPELPLNLQKLYLRDYSSLEQLPDLSYLKLLERLSIESCDSLRSISILPSHLQSLSVEDCTSLQDLPDLSMLKELALLKVTVCNNLKSISLKESSLEVLLSAHLPNREVAEWFSYKSSGHTITFDIPPSIGSKFLGLALWVVYTCKPTYQYSTYIKAVITNNTESITENYSIFVYTKVGEALSRVECIPWKNMPPIKSGDRINISFKGEEKVKMKMKMCGVHFI